MKIANTSNAEQKVTVNFKGIKTLPAGMLTLLHADNLLAENKIDNKTAVIPVTTDVQPSGNVLSLTIQPNSFVVFRSK